MLSYSRTVIVLVLFMCVVRGVLAGVAYAAPQWTFAVFGLDVAPDSLQVYFLRLWAGRDFLLAAFVLLAPRDYLKLALFACCGVELFDYCTVTLGYSGGVFDTTQYIGQMLAVTSAFVPEAVALRLVLRESEGEMVRA